MKCLVDDKQVLSHNYYLYVFQLVNVFYIYFL